MPVSILSVAQMRAWEEATWRSGVTQADVITRVGQALALHLSRLARPGDHVLVVAGKGNNGADARAMANNHGASAFLALRIQVVDVLDPRTDMTALESALAAGPDLIVDGLFGIGLDRPLDEHWQRVFQAINRSGRPVLAVDIPSGMNADTGEDFGAAVQATWTVAVGAPKKGMLAAAATDRVGRLIVADDVGLAGQPETTDLQWTLPGDFRDFPPRRPVQSHKGAFGHLQILAGSVGYHGAAVLAARGAMRARPGLITLETQPECYVPVAAQLAQVMVRAWDSTATRMQEDYTGVMAGPGLVAESIRLALERRVVHAWRESPVPWVVDASALDWIPPGPHRTQALRVITPHPGEAARLLGTRTNEILANRVDAVRRLSSRWGNCAVVLKGHQTLIGRATGPVYVNDTGNPGLAQGGSGDVLAGYIAGLLAQSAHRADPMTAIRYAVRRHGATADALDAKGTSWTIEDLVQQL